MYEDVAVRVLSAGNFPAHRTMAEFRQRHLKEFKKLFGQVARIAAEAGTEAGQTVYRRRKVIADWSSWGEWRWTAVRSRPTPANIRR